MSPILSIFRSPEAVNYAPATPVFDVIEPSSLRPSSTSRPVHTTMHYVVGKCSNSSRSVSKPLQLPSSCVSSRGSCSPISFFIRLWTSTFGILCCFHVIPRILLKQHCTAITYHIMRNSVNQRATAMIRDSVSYFCPHFVAKQIFIIAFHLKEFEIEL